MPVCWSGPLTTGEPACPSADCHNLKSLQRLVDTLLVGVSLRRGRQVTKRSPEYDAFISYSHALDGKLAPIIQRELERFAKPWYRLQSLRVFRDDASLAANPGLWSSIEEGLSSSQWFILMASPEAARSRWVDREVAWWLEHRSVQHLLVVLTSGELVWDENTGDFDWAMTSALPPALHGVLGEEPRWIDLRWLRDAGQADRANPRLHDCVADVAAAVMGKPKDLLVGEHIRQHRRAVQLARSGVTALAALLVLTVVAAVVAVGQRNTAIKDARVATAGELAALASSNLNSQFDLAQLLAVQAYRMDPDSQTLAALFQAVTASPYLERYLPVGVQVTVLAGSADGDVVVAGTADGHLVRWDVDRGTRSEVRVGHSKVTAIAVSSDGMRIVAADNAKTYLWNASLKTNPGTIYTGEALSVAVSPSGRTVAVLSGSLSSPGLLMIIDGTSGRELRHTSSEPFGFYVGLPNDNTAIVDHGNGTWSRLPVASLTPITNGGQLDTPGDLFYCCGYSQDGSYFVWSKFGYVNIVNEKPNASNQRSGAGQLETAAMPLQEPNQFAVSEDGTEVAAAGGDALYVAPASASGNIIARQLPGTGGITALAFLGNSQHLVSASGTAVVLWNLSQVSRIAVDPSINAPDGSNVGVPPQIAFSPDGKHIAITGDKFSPIIVQNLGKSSAAETVMNTPVFSDDSTYSATPLWSVDSKRLFLLGDNGNGDTAVQWSDGRFGAAWPTTSARWGRASGQVLAARLSPNGQRLVFIDDRGDIQVRSVADGAILYSLPGIKQAISQDPPQNLAAISDDTAMTAIVLPDGTVRITAIDSGYHHDLPGTLANAVIFTQNRLLIECQDNSLEVWNPSGTHLYRSIPGDAIYAHGITTIPHTQLVARVTEQGAVVLSNLDSGQSLGSLTLPYPARATGEPAWDATTVAASPDGSALLSATTSGSVVRWQLNPDAWIQAACAAANQDLTPDEWRQTVGTTPPTDLSCHD